MMSGTKLLELVRRNRGADDDAETAIAMASALVLVWNVLPAETRGTICGLLRPHILDPNAFILHGMQIRRWFDDNSWA